METVRSFQREQNQNRRHQLMQIERRYAQAFAEEKTNVKEAMQRFEEAKCRNRKLKIINHFLKNLQKQM